MRGTVVARKLNVLIIDDSVMTRKMVMKAVHDTKLAEFHFTEADDGLDAMEKFKPDDTDLILVDMKMPRMDGVSFLKELHENFVEYPPAIMITAESAEDRVKSAIEEGRVDGFLLKPVDKERMTKGLKKLVDSIPDRSGPSQVPHGEVVPEAMVEMLKQTAGLELTPTEPDEDVRHGDVAFGTIAILGGLQWSVVLGFQKDTAAAIASRFAGFEIPADSADMGDAISELTNITAGQIKRLLVAQGLDVEISLPIVTTASNIRTLAQRSTTCDHRHFDSELGKMWCSVTVGMNPGLIL